MFTLTLVYLEYETSVSIWEFEIMIEISIMPFGNANIHEHINVSEFINKLSFICVLEI